MSYITIDVAYELTGLNRELVEAVSRKQISLAERYAMIYFLKNANPNLTYRHIAGLIRNDGGEYWNRSILNALSQFVSAVENKHEYFYAAYLKIEPNLPPESKITIKPFKTK